MDELNSFNNLRHAHMARGEFMWGGYAVVIDPRLPREHIGDEVASFAGHRFWRWLWPIVFRRPFPPTMARGAAIMEGKIFMSQNKLFMTRDTFERLRKAAA